MRQEGAANAWMWGNIINTAGDTMSDLIKYKAGESGRKLADAQTARLMREEDKAKLLDTLAVTARDLPPAARAEVYATHGFDDKADEITRRTNAATDRSNKQQVGALIGIYGEDDPDEVRRQGMAVEPEMTGKFLRERAEEEERKEARGYRQVTSLPAVFSAGMRVLKTPIRDQADLDARRKAIEPYAKMGGLQDVFAQAFSPTFDPVNTETERRAALQWMDEAKPAINEFAVFHAGWVAEHGPPKTAKESAALISAFSASQRAPEKPEKGEEPFKDNPKFPTGVDHYLTKMRNSGYTREQAESELARAMPELQAAHPNLSGIEVQKALDVYWPIRPPVYDLAGNPVKGTTELKPPVNPAGAAPGLASLARPSSAMPQAALPAAPPPPPAGPMPPAAPAAPAGPLPAPTMAAAADEQVRAQAERLMNEIVSLERQGQQGSPMHTQKVAELRRLLAR
jgi:hypothetical protein